MRRGRGSAARRGGTRAVPDRRAAPDRRDPRPGARQDRPRRGRERRPPRARTRRRRGRGVPRDRAQGARPPPGRPTTAPAAPSRAANRARPSRTRSSSSTSAASTPSSSRAASASSTSTRSSSRSTRPGSEIARRRPRGVILSGGPASVYEEGAPRPDPRSGRPACPILGICYGLHLMAQELGGDVLPATKREYGPAILTVTDDGGLFAGLDRSQPVWMSHGDSLVRPPAGFRPTAQTDSTPFAALADAERALYGIQFHPEVVHTPRGREIIRNFVARDRRRPPHLDPGELHRDDGQRDPLPGGRAREGDRRRREGHLRALRRRRLGGRRGPRPSRRRGPAHVHLRGPRAHAQEGDASSCA